MKFIDIVAQDRPIFNEVKVAVTKEMSKGHFIQGNSVKVFEENIQNFTGIHHAIGVGSGTSALDLVLQSLNLEKGSEIITSPFSYYATTEVILRNGLIPHFIDIEEDSYNLDPYKILAAINEKTRAILPVHIFGKPVNMIEVQKIANQNSLKLVEDCAQAIGTKLNGKHVGTFGEGGCLSFYPTKNLGCYGDGGMILTNDDQIAEALKKLQNNGASLPYLHELVGTNSRLDSLQAVILDIKLKVLGELNQQRQKNAAFYFEKLKNLSEIVLPKLSENEEHTFHQFTIRAQKRNELKAFLEKWGIPSQIYYEKPLSQQPVFNFQTFCSENLPVTERICSEVLSLPIAPHLSEEDINFITQKIIDFYLYYGE